MASELSLNHVGQDTIVVTGTAAGIPKQRQMDGSGHYVNDANGRPQYLRPTHALIYVGNQPVRWRADGIPPVAAPGMGMFVAAGGYIDWTHPQGNFSGLIDRVQFVRAEGSTANGYLEISYFT